MQWLIHIIAAKVIDTIGVPPCFYPRGDLVDPDWAVGDLVKDGGWHNLAIPPIVPPDATGIAIELLAMCAAASAGITLRPSATSGIPNYGGLYTQGAMLMIEQDVVLGMGALNTIQYSIANFAWPVLNMTVKGWWL